MEKMIIFGNELQAQKIISRINNYNGELLSTDLLDDDVMNDVFTENTVYVAADDSREQILLSNGVSRDKIINFSRFEKTTFDNPIDRFECNKVYTGLIMGMSHSQCAITPEDLDDNNYCMLSSPSFDMFCHLNFAKKLAELYPNELLNIEHVIIELPYYIFNYDLSKFGAFVYTKLKYFDIIDNYHHFGKTLEQKKLISEFERFKAIFGRENSEKKFVKQRNPIKQILKKIYNMYCIATNNDKVWNKIYRDTIQENRDLWHDLLKLLGETCPKAKISVLVMPFNPIFRYSHINSINRMKTVFLESLGEGGFRIIDHFARLNRTCYFDDHCHLNKKGASKYMTIIKAALGDK